MAEKESSKSGNKSRRQPGGFTGADDPRRGRGPKKGAPNAGRPPSEWKELCRNLASRKAMLDQAKAVLANPKHPAWLGAWKFLAEQGYGKAVQPISGPDGKTPAAIQINLVKPE